MTKESLIQFIEHGSEERNIEYKQSMNWEQRETKMKVIKCCLAMANLQDGGVLIFGIEELNGQCTPKGMDDEDYESFNQDDISVQINKYADPAIEIKMDKIEYNDKMFCVIQIPGINDLPVICKKGSGEELKRGTIYIRPKSKIESVPVSTQNEMREIIDYVVKQKLNEINEICSQITPNKEEIDEQKYDDEVKGL